MIGCKKGARAFGLQDTAYWCKFTDTRKSAWVCTVLGIDAYLMVPSECVGNTGCSFLNFLLGLQSYSATPTLPQFEFFFHSAPHTEFSTRKNSKNCVGKTDQTVRQLQQSSACTSEHSVEQIRLSQSNPKQSAHQAASIPVLGTQPTQFPNVLRSYTPPATSLWLPLCVLPTEVEEEAASKIQRTWSQKRRAPSDFCCGIVLGTV